MPGKEWTFEACWQSVHLEVMILEELNPASFELFLGTSAALLLFVRPLFLSVRPWLLTRVPIPRSSADGIQFLCVVVPFVLCVWGQSLVISHHS